MNEPTPAQHSPTAAPDLPPPTSDPTPIKAAHIANQSPSIPAAKPKKPYLATTREKNIAARMLAQGEPSRAIARVIGRSASTVERVKAELVPSLDSARIFDQRHIRSLEAMTDKQLAYYDSALDNGLVNPSTIPLGYGILMTKRAELLSDARQLVPIGTNASPESFLSTLLSDPSSPVLNTEVVPA